MLHIAFWLPSTSSTLLRGIIISGVHGVFHIPLMCMRKQFNSIIYVKNILNRKKGRKVSVLG